MNKYIHFQPDAKEERKKHIKVRKEMYLIKIKIIKKGKEKKIKEISIIENEKLMKYK